MKKQKEGLLDRIFLLNWKKLWIAVVLGFIAVVVHNGFDIVFGVEEPVFFIFAVLVVPIYLVLAGVYSMVIFYKRGLRINKQSIISIILGCILGYGSVYFSGFFNGSEIIFGFFASLFFAVVIYFFLLFGKKISS